MLFFFKIQPHFPYPMNRFFSPLVQGICSICLFLIVIFLLNGCAPLFTSPEGSRNIYRTLPDKYGKKALEYEKAGQWYEALLCWRIVKTFYPYDNELANRIKTLRKKAHANAAEHYQKGIKFYQNGFLKDARREFLFTLTYEPDHAQALDYLENKLHEPVLKTYMVQKGDTVKKIASKSYHDPNKAFLITAYNDLRSESELWPGEQLEIVVLDQNFPKTKKKDEAVSLNAKEQANIEKTPLIKKTKINGSEPRAESGLETSSPVEEKNTYLLRYREAKELLDKKEHLESLKVLRTIDPNYRDVRQLIVNTELYLQEEAEAHYRKGVSYFLSDELDKAIEEWSETIRLIPNHLKALKDLQNARRLKQKLENY